MIKVLYFLIGLVLALWIWEQDYNKEYEQLKKKGENPEYGAVGIFLLLIIIFWPVFILWRIFLKRF